MTTLKSNMHLLVKQMNEAFGNPEGDPTLFSLPSSNPTGNQAWSRLRSQCKNIRSELKELETAIEMRDIDGVRDALCDINVFSLGAHHFMGFDADADMLEVVTANMTRLCRNEEQLLVTQDQYRKLGIDFYIEGEFPAVCLKSSRDQGVNKADGTCEYPKGKFLKAAGYRIPEFYKP